MIVPHDDIARDGVVGRLEAESHRFEFYQAARLLELLLDSLSPSGAARESTPAHIEFRPHTGLGFPASDVKQIEWVSDTVARVTVTFMGLYGVASPLPNIFYEEIAQETDGSYALRDFLDIFNQRLYEAFYKSWKKYNPVPHFEQSYENEHARVYLSLAGLANPGVDAALPDGLSPLRMAAFAGRLQGQARNAEGLQALLAGLLEEIPVRIQENVPRWVPLASRAGLGPRSQSPAKLGFNTIMGGRVFDVSNKFRLLLGPLTFQQYQDLLPGGAQARRIHALVRLFAPDFLDYDVALLLDAAEAAPMQLGNPNLRMGTNTWVGRPAGPVFAKTVTYP